MAVSLAVIESLELDPDLGEQGWSLSDRLMIWEGVGWSEGELFHRLSPPRKLKIY